MKIKKILIWILTLVGLILVVGGGFYLIYVRPVLNQFQVIKTVPYDKQLTLVLGGGGNSGILVSDSLVLVIDTKMDDAAESFHRKVKDIAGDKPIIVINTHVHNDHAGGNSLYKGQTIIAGSNYDKAFWIGENGNGSLPTKWVKDSLILKIGSETVTVLNLGFAAHTQSDIMVYLHNRKLLFTGDLVLNKYCPALVSKYKASSEGYLAASKLMQKRFKIATVVPGHGDIGGRALIDVFRQYFLDMKAVADNAPDKSALIDKYKSWSQIPFIMSPGATVKNIREEEKGN